MVPKENPEFSYAGHAQPTPTCTAVLSEDLKADEQLLHNKGWRGATHRRVGELETQY